MRIKPPVVSGFYARTVTERVALLQAAGWLTPQDAALLLRSQATLDAAGADRMVENVIGVLGLPLALGLNVMVDERIYQVPMAVEEPSILAAVSSAAKVAQAAGGFHTTFAESLLAGQVQVVGLSDASAAQRHIMARAQAVMDEANALLPNMVARGGGVKDVTVRALSDDQMIIVHLWVDTCDAMGANCVNTLCEAMAPLLAEWAGGTAGLRILSNLADRSVVHARCVLPPEVLSHGGASGEAIRDGIVAASRMAELDVYRAATHNKGVMNGIDAVALATGNDWRAIEAGAHAYAGKADGYTPLTRWRSDAQGNLVGDIKVPLKVGIRGGNFLANPSVALALRILDVASAKELARIMAAVGLAQNFAALRALSSQGIQAGHMTLHARSVVASAGAPPEHFAAAVAQLIASQDLKLARAQQIVAALVAGKAEACPAPPVVPAPYASQMLGKTSEGTGSGKLIVCGEHAVVYGTHALAVPLALATRVVVQAQSTPGIMLIIPAWGVQAPLPSPQERAETGNSLFDSLRLIVQHLNLSDAALCVTVHAHVPRAMGLGSSAALAVACVRALAAHVGQAMTNEAVIALALEAEKVAHGTPSGVDNALATMGCPLLFRKQEPKPWMQAQAVKVPMPWVIGLTPTESLTATTVAQVRAARNANPSHYDHLFGQIDRLTCEAAQAMGAGDLPHVGRLMNLNHGYLNTLDVSTVHIEKLVHLARQHGALGAKVTGGGGGGSMLALCQDPKHAALVADAMKQAGYRALLTTTEVTGA